MKKGFLKEWRENFKKAIAKETIYREEVKFSKEAQYIIDRWNALFENKENWEEFQRTGTIKRIDAEKRRKKK